MQKSYYLIRQEIPYLEPKTIKIYEPNYAHLKQFISALIGNIEVYFYNHEDNSRKNVTSEFENEPFYFDKYPLECIVDVVYIYKRKDFQPKRFKAYGLKNKTYEPVPKKFFINGYVFFYELTDRTILLNSTLFFCDLESKNRNNVSGSEYERFIADKYKESGYKVILNGINKSYNDGGIDIIAENDTTVLLVQCKNWAQSNQYKINQKDIRAFVGDCFLYMRNNPTGKKVGFHFIVSHRDFLTKSAEIFLQQNTFIKFKTISFEKKDIILPLAPPGSPTPSPPTATPAGSTLP